MKIKIIFSIVSLLLSVTLSSQEQKILKILNRELQKEVRAQQDASDYYGEAFEVVKPYSIKDSLGGKFLTLEIKKQNYYNKTFYTIRQETELSKIKTIVKDINVIFDTEPDAVTITETEENGKKHIYTENMFFLRLSHEKKNDKLGKELVKAFKKSGYTIKKEFWYD